MVLVALVLQLITRRRPAEVVLDDIVLLLEVVDGPPLEKVRVTVLRASGLRPAVLIGALAAVVDDKRTDRRFAVLVDEVEPALSRGHEVGPEPPVVLERAQPGRRPVLNVRHQPVHRAEILLGGLHPLNGDSLPLGAPDGVAPACVEVAQQLPGFRRRVEDGRVVVGLEIERLDQSRAAEDGTHLRAVLDVRLDLEREDRQLRLPDECPEGVQYCRDVLGSCDVRALDQVPEAAEQWDLLFKDQVVGGVFR